MAVNLNRNPATPGNPKSSLTLNLALPSLQSPNQPPALMVSQTEITPHLLRWESRNLLPCHYSKPKEASAEGLPTHPPHKVFSSWKSIIWSGDRSSLLHQPTFRQPPRRGRFINPQGSKTPPRRFITTPKTLGEDFCLHLTFD